eukprot:11164538-Lingulodinium_polyedra.AAC.1
MILDFWGVAGMEELGVQCHGVANKCSFTGRPCRRLEGRAANSRNWTSVAEPYPRRPVLRHASVTTTPLAVRELR